MRRYYASLDRRGSAYEKSIKETSPKSYPAVTGFADCMGENPTVSMSKPGSGRVTMSIPSVNAEGIRTGSRQIPVEDSESATPTSVGIGRGRHVNPRYSGMPTVGEIRQAANIRKRNPHMDSETAINIVQSTIPKKRLSRAPTDSIASVSIEAAAVNPAIPLLMGEIEGLDNQLVKDTDSLNKATESGDKAKIKTAKEAVKNTKEKLRTKEKELKSAVGKQARVLGLSETDSGNRLVPEYNPETGKLIIRFIKPENRKDSIGKWIDGRYFSAAVDWTEEESLDWDSDMDRVRYLCYIYLHGLSPTAKVLDRKDKSKGVAVSHPGVVALSKATALAGHATGVHRSALGKGWVTDTWRTYHVSRLRCRHDGSMHIELIDGPHTRYIPWPALRLGNTWMSFVEAEGL